VDDGPGIPPHAMRDLVRRWSQGPDGEALGQGSGLGLAIVARYAQLLGAQLTMGEAVPGAGGLRVNIGFGAP
jgi:two-component system sensor histidine kinase TctE